MLQDVGTLAHAKYIRIAMPGANHANPPTVVQSAV